MNKEFNYLKEGLTTDLIQFIINDYGMDFQSAMNTLYESATFSKFSDPSTGLYFQSSPYVYTFLQNELETGKIN